MRPWLGSYRCRTTGSINDDIPAFIAWFNTEIAATVGHAAIDADQHGNITGSRLRRTLAWHIVRRPGGTVAGATQYGHLHTQHLTGYAGNAASGFLDEISFEEFLLRANNSTTTTSNSNTANTSPAPPPTSTSNASPPATSSPG